MTFGRQVSVRGTRYELYDPRECRIKRREKLISAKLQRAPTFFRESVPFIRIPRRTQIIHAPGYIYAS